MRTSLSLVAALCTLAAIVSSCYTNPVQRYKQGIIVHLAADSSDGPRLVRLQVESDNIIRVSATREKKFADPQSLIIVDRAVATPFDVVENGDTVVLSTSRLSAQILTTTGEITFFSAAGDTLLQELPGGGKHLTPYTVTRTTAAGDEQEYSGWTTQTVFASPADEAFYGLGQHQADEWNYKGRDEELFQYNTKVSIPFVVSTKHYGLLFDTYSLCRFGHSSDYQQLGELFTLRDNDGVEGALTGTYTTDTSSLVRREENIYFEDLQSAKNLPSFPLATATVVYEGTLTAHASGTYKFKHYYSGYQRIYIDGQPVYTDDVQGKGVADQTVWRAAWNPNARKFSVDMEEGKEYSFRLEWQPDGDEAYCGVRAYAPLSADEEQQLSFWSEMSKQMDYYFIAGETSDEVIAGYRTLTGKAPLMPEWLFGYWQSRERYKTQDEILAALDGFRQRQLPIDNIVMDWNYWVDDEWGAFTFDPARFADPQAMVDSIHANHATIMISCWPKYYLKPANFAELNDKGLLYQQSLRDSIYDWIGYMYAFYDAYAPEGRKIFWRQMYENLGTIGIDAWWMDASEPNIRDCTDLDYRKQLCGPTYLGASDEYFNAYSIVNAEAIYDGQRGYETAGLDHDAQWLQEHATWDQRGFGNTFSPDNKRVFLLTRNGFASQQRYATATWSGDIGTRWEDMKTQIPAALNFAMSGIPYWSQDIGGFSVEGRYAHAQLVYDRTGVVNDDLRDWRELNVRWHQFGMWAPLYRAHGQFPYREPWNIAPESSEEYAAIRNCMLLRYRLLPYIYSLGASVHYDDYTIMRPLVMDFDNDTTVRDIAYQFMFGPAFMINPVYTYKARSREVYFPQGTIWYDFFAGTIAATGGEYKTVAAPLAHIPIYVRAGAIIPFGKAVEYTRQAPNDILRIYVYQGADGQFTLYEDEGVNYGYEEGRFVKIPFRYDESTKTLTIGEQEGTYPGALTQRTFVIVPVSADKAQPYDPEAEGKEVEYTGASLTVAL